MRKGIESLPTLPAGKWRLDSDSARVELSTPVFGATVHVVFNDLSGVVEIGSRPLGSSVFLSIQAASLRSGNRSRDHVLRSTLGLDVRRFPIIAFRGAAVTWADGHTLVVEGELEVRGRTVPLTMPVRVRSADDCRTDLFARAEITPSRLGLQLPVPSGVRLPGRDPALSLAVSAAIGNCVASAA